MEGGGGLLQVDMVMITPAAGHSLMVRRFHPHHHSRVPPVPAQGFEPAIASSHHRPITFTTQSLRHALIETGVLSATTQGPGASGGESMGSPIAALTFEQQKDLLLLQMERDKLGIEKEWLRQSLEKEKL